MIGRICPTIQFLSCLLLITSHSLAEESTRYVQTQDVVYAEVHGTGLLMDVFTPTGTANGRAIIDVASGAWYSDRGKIRDHTQAQFYSIFCSRGYIVFAIRPGSKTRYTALEMDQHVKMGIRHVKQCAEKFQFDSTKIGLTGASAGGHLACLAALTPAAGDLQAKNPLEKLDSSVAAVAAFFPPTDFLEWNPGEMVNLKVIGPLLAVGAEENQDLLGKKSQEELQELAKAISPLHQVNQPRSPFLLIHGDADKVVPLSQSQKLASAIQKAGGSAELIVKEGGGHPWLTIPVEVGVMADWFDRQLQ